MQYLHGNGCTWYSYQGQRTSHQPCWHMRRSYQGRQYQGVVVGHEYLWVGLGLDLLHSRWWVLVVVENYLNKITNTEKNKIITQTGNAIISMTLLRSGSQFQIFFVSCDSHSCLKDTFSIGCGRAVQCTTSVTLFLTLVPLKKFPIDFTIFQCPFSE